MNQNLNQPLNGSINSLPYIQNHGMYSQNKIGQSGPINWYYGAKYVRAVYQFSESAWQPNKFPIKIQIQKQLVLQRQLLNLGLQVNRLNKCLIPAYIFLGISLILYFIVLFNTTDYIDDVTANFIIFYFLGYFSIVLVVLILTIRMAFKSMKRIQHAIAFLNLKLQQNGLNLIVRLKKKCPFKTFFNYTHVQVFEKIYY